MKKVALLCAIVLVLSLVTVAGAQKAQTVDILLSKLITNYAMETAWGNVYFGQRDLHHLIHAAAHLKPVNLGTFQTDQGVAVAVAALGFDKGVVTLNVTPQ